MNLTQIFSKKSFESLHRTVLRFDVCLILCGLLFILDVWEIYSKEKNEHFMTLFFSAITMAGLHLLQEPLKTRRLYSYGLGLGCVFFFHFTLGHSNQIFSLGLLGCALGAFVFIAPAGIRPLSDKDLWRHQLGVFYGLLRWALVTFLLWVASMGVWASLLFLFDISFRHEHMLTFYLFSGSVLGPLVFLSSLPFSSETETEGEKNLRQGGFVFNMGQYFFIPLSLIYGLILYIYGAKLILLQALPVNLVVYLVTGFSFVSLLAYGLTNTTTFEKKFLTQWFRRFIFLLLIPPLMLMGMVLYSRLQAYGLTAGRYLVVLIWIWLTLAVVGSWITSQRVRFMMLSGVGLLFLGSLGPWSIDSLPITMQLHRLETVLEENKVIIEGEVQKGPHVLKSQAIKTIESALNYLSRKDPMGFTGVIGRNEPAKDYKLKKVEQWLYGLKNSPFSEAHPVWPSDSALFHPALREPSQPIVKNFLDRLQIQGEKSPAASEEPAQKL